MGTEAILRQAQDDRVLNCDAGAVIKLSRQRRAISSDAGAVIKLNRQRRSFDKLRMIGF